VSQQLPTQQAGPASITADRTDAQRIIRDFTLLYHGLAGQTLSHSRWLGVPYVKTPGDLLALGEIVADTRPDLIIETGVFAGGSTLFYASMLDLLGIEGRVIAIDIELNAPPAVYEHPKVELIEGSSIDPDVVSRLRAESEGRRVMLDLDSDHDGDHVLAELRALSDLVTPGCYLIVEDTWFGSRPVRPDVDPAPGDAVDTWLAEGPPFELDRWRERALLTGNPRGYLRRIDHAASPPESADTLRPKHFVVPEAMPVGHSRAAGNGAAPVAVSASGGDPVGVPEVATDELRRERWKRIEAERELDRAREQVRSLLEEVHAQRELMREKDRMITVSKNQARRARTQLRQVTSALPVRAYMRLRRMPVLRNLGNTLSRRRALSRAKRRPISR
jgi:cephalosporin hydroxylase